MKLTIPGETRIVTSELDLPSFIATPEEKIQKFCLELAKPYPKGEKPEIRLRFIPEKDQLELTVTEARVYKMKFETPEKQMKYFNATEDQYKGIMEDLDSQRGRIFLKINGTAYEFTKWQYKGLEQRKPKVYTMDLQITEEEQRDRDEKRSRYVAMLKELSDKNFNLPPENETESTTDTTA